MRTLRTPHTRGLNLATLLAMAILTAMTLAPRPVTAQAPTLLTEPLAPLSAQAARATLTVVGGSSTQRLSVADLERLPMHRLRTQTFWPDDDGTYEGPLLAEVLKRAGIDGAKEVRVRALDDFSQLIPQEDWKRWPVLLATRRDGKPLSTRDKGPLRVIYPRDMDPTLSEETYRLRWVWLVNRIEVATP